MEAMNRLLEEFAECTIDCESGDGSSIKVKDIKKIGIDSTMFKECYVSPSPRKYWNVCVTLKGEVDDEYEKGTPEFEKALENYLISVTLK